MKTHCRSPVHPQIGHWFPFITKDRLCFRKIRFRRAVAVICWPLNNPLSGGGEKMSHKMPTAIVGKKNFFSIYSSEMIQTLKKKGSRCTRS